jgi:nucleotide-binding universal stress UspA family protein
MREVKAVTIKSMLARLQSTLGQPDLVEQMLLIPEPQAFAEVGTQLHEQAQKAINLVVGYTGSPCSQTALDLTLWIAHQTRLATQKQVTVHVVYVVDEVTEPLPDRASRFLKQGRAAYQAALGFKTARGSTATLVRSSAPFEQADRVLWQARCLAEEWRGSLSTHLRIGDRAEELRQVAIAESVDVVVLGCRSVRHPLILQWAADFPCAVLGIPATASLN